MLVELSVILVVVGVLMLAVGIFIARQYTLRAKLLTAFLMIVMSSLGILTLLDGRIMQETLSKSAQQSLTSASRVYANRLDEFIRVHTSSIRAESSLPSIVNAVAKNKSDSLQNRRELLQALQSKQNSLVTSYAILNINGINVTDTNGENIGRDESAQPYFVEAVNKKMLTIHPLFLMTVMKR